MHKFFTSPELVLEDNARIVGEDVKHIYKVLRLDEGEIVRLNDSNGNEYLAKIESISKTEVRLSILEKLEVNNESPVEITLFQGLPKAQKMDLIVQKGTELGLKSFVPVLTKRVDVKLKGDFKKLDRLNRIALEAAKQSKRSIIPKVVEPIEFKSLLEQLKKYDLVIVPYENKEEFGMKKLVSEINKDEIKTIAIMVGPEGGFEEEEIKELENVNGRIITLGNRILRTETAGFTITSLIQYEFGDLGGR
ncbi:MAG: RsmE family RNA methyltransferase [Clostridium sp.]